MLPMHCLAADVRPSLADKSMALTIQERHHLRQPLHSFRSVLFRTAHIYAARRRGHVTEPRTHPTKSDDAQTSTNPRRNN